MTESQAPHSPAPSPDAPAPAPAPAIGEHPAASHALTPEPAAGPAAAPLAHARLLPPVATPARRPVRASARFMFQHPAHFIALGAGSGLSPKAPGTAGTLWAWAAYLVAMHWLPDLSNLHMAAGLGVATAVAIWASTVTARNLNIADPGCIVVDEVVAFWLVLWLVMPASFTAQLCAFALFRVLDAVKPGPVAWADEAFKGGGWRGGFGIVFDDLVAAFLTVFIIALWRF